MRSEGVNTICSFREEIHRVFANVIRNAIEAVPQGGTITLHVLASQEWNGVRRPGARGVIADTGTGHLSGEPFLPLLHNQG